jgi:peptidoglycan hydrolase-like protein with peptidoglycan-binding domain
VSTMAFAAHADAFANASVLMARKHVIEVQAALRAMGFYDGPHDGRYGPNLRRSIEAFERSDRRVVTGIASRDLLQRLTMAMAGLGKPPPGAVPPLETGSVGSAAPSSAIIPDTVKRR